MAKPAGPTPGTADELRELIREANGILKDGRALLKELRAVSDDAAKEVVTGIRKFANEQMIPQFQAEMIGYVNRAEAALGKRLDLIAKGIGVLEESGMGAQVPADGTTLRDVARAGALNIAGCRPVSAKGTPPELLREMRDVTPQDVKHDCENCDRPIWVVAGNHARAQGQSDAAHVHHVRCGLCPYCGGQRRRQRRVPRGGPARARQKDRREGAPQ